MSNKYTIDPGIVKHEQDLTQPDKTTLAAQMYEQFKRKRKRNQQDRFLNKREAAEHPSLHRR